MRPLLVGESNPYGSGPEYALYPAPDGCSGHRLATNILGMSRVEYLDRFDRLNLCAAEWCEFEARMTIAKIESKKLILLGTKVCSAFEVRYEPLSVVARGEQKLLVLPHPSGRARYWNETNNILLARVAVLEFIR